AGIAVLAIDARRLARELGALRGQLRAITRECALLRRAPLVIQLDALATEQLEVVVREWMPQVDGRVLATVGPEPAALAADRPTLAIEVGPPSVAQRAARWHAALGEGTPEDSELLAERYPLAPGLIDRAARAARLHAAGAPLEPGDIFAGIR